ncbi:uncharacterized protein LOC135088086 [Ostrinia nubilalis]|uniref:uncharacterized protein LOC135088086 n=1 Tax=Ostrinia nubilalis TaxID=29057 RepID=UPI0030825593
MFRIATLLVLLCVGYLTAEKPVVHLDSEKMVEILPQVIQCVAETGVNIEALDKLRLGVPGEIKDPNLPKFAHCAFLKTGYSHENGRAKVDKVLKLFPAGDYKAALKKHVQECDKDGKDPVDTTYQFLKCLYMKSPVIVRF